MKKVVVWLTSIFSLVFINVTPANVITVDMTGDVSLSDEFCTLREAINSANNNDPDENSGCGPGSVGLDMIEFAENLAGPIELEQPDFLHATDVLFISGPKRRGLMKVIGNGTNRVIRASDTRLFVENLEVTGGRLEGGTLGAGVYLSRSLGVFRNVSIRDNIGGAGGGVGAADSDVALLNSSVTDNSARFLGGGVAVTGSISRLFVEDSTISGNHSDIHGGGVYFGGNLGGDLLQFVGSTISNNNANATGGGIWADGQRLRFFNSLIVDNSANDSMEIYTSGVVDGNFRNIIGDASKSSTEALRRVSAFERNVLATSDKRNILAGKIIGSLRKGDAATYLHPLVSGSIAIGTAVQRHCEEVDQEGKSRVSDFIFPLVSAANGKVAMIDLSDDCDVGAVEFR